MKGERMATKRKEFWGPRDLAVLALVTGMQKCHLQAIIDRKRGVSVKKAKLLAAETAAICAKDVPWTAWVDNKETDHKAFKKLK
jgi:hypothetical protein